MRIDIEEIRRLKDRLREINKFNVNQIEWYENGVKLEIDKDVVDRWRFTGMNTSDFIDTDFYKETKESISIFESH